MPRWYGRHLVRQSDGMSPLPTPARASIGMAAAAISAARELPRKLVELPVIAAGTALQLSLRAQQQYAEFIARGDEILGQLRGIPDEPPSWATFDESPAAETRSSDRSRPATAEASQVGELTDAIEGEAMAELLEAEALAALGSGWLFDRSRGGALLGLPLLVSAVPVLAFASSPLLAVAGVLMWGAAGGVLDSTVKALVADLVPASRRATAYGVFAAVQGAAAVAGGVMAGALYERSLPILITAVVITQIIALILLIATLRHQRKINNAAAGVA